jgi:hypothetical protein
MASVAMCSAPYQASCVADSAQPVLRLPGRQGCAGGGGAERCWPATYLITRTFSIVTGPSNTTATLPDGRCAAPAAMSTSRRVLRTSPSCVAPNSSRAHFFAEFVFMRAQLTASDVNSTGYATMDTELSPGAYRRNDYGVEQKCGGRRLESGVTGHRASAMSTS